MQVTKEGIEQIKAANELAAILGERGIAVKRKGESLVASCPFHQEKTPSFTVTPSKGLFHCFGCGASGDVIGFVSKHDKVSFSEALEVLSKRAGLRLSEVMKERRRSTRSPSTKKTKASSPKPTTVSPDVLSRVIEHYHKTLCEIRVNGLGWIKLANFELVSTEIYILVIYRVHGNYIRCFDLCMRRI